MSQGLQDMLRNYSTRQILGDKVHVKGRKDGEVVLNGYFKIYATIETNYSRISIDWPENGVLPAEYQEHYGAFENKYPVDFEYFEDDDIIHLSGKYGVSEYKVVIQLPEK